jgi:phage shock protein A
MAETIANRVARIIAGGAHALLDKAENAAPEAIMAQAIREVEQIIGEVRGDLGKAEAAKHLVLSQIAKLNTEHDQLGAHTETALAQNRDDLATAAIGRQTDIEDLLPVLQKSLDDQNEQAREFESYVVALLAKKRELDGILADYYATRASLRTSPSPANTPERQTRVDDAESSFGRALARQTGTGILASGMTANAGKLRELADMQRNNRISERLATVKALRFNKEQ